MNLNTLMVYKKKRKSFFIFYIESTLVQNFVNLPLIQFYKS